MSLKSEGDYVKQYAVKIIYKNKHKMEGSGFLIKVDSFVYLFTARHNFKLEEDDEFFDVDINLLEENLDCITVTKGDNKPVLEIDSILFENQKLDLLVFKTKNINLDIPHSNSFLKDSRFHEEKCFFYGYPKNKDGRAERGLIYTATKEKNNTFLLQRGMNIKNTNYFAGYSGSGVFIKKNEVYYIVGVVIKADDKLDNFEVIDLSKIIDDINQKLKEKSLSLIPIKEHVFDMIDVSNMYKKLFERHPNNFLIKKLLNLFGREHSYKDLIEPSDKLERLHSYTTYTNDFKEIEDRYTQELADIYLMSTFIASIYQDKEKAKEHFKEACKYRPHYNLFLTEIDRENSKEELLNSAKVAYTDREYNYSKECFTKVLSLKCSYSEKKDILYYLLKIAKINDNKEEQYNIYSKLFNLYSKSEHYERADIFYNVSLLLKDKLEKITFLEKGDNEIDYRNEFLELKYLIKKELYYLQPTKEQYKQLKMILYVLVKLKPNYQKELVEIQYYELQSFIEKIIKSLKIILIFLFFWMIYLLFQFFYQEHIYYQ